MLSTRAISRGSRYSVEDLFDMIYNRKVQHQKLAEKYRSSPAMVIEKILVSKFNVRTTYRYESLKIDYSVFAPHLLLSLFIAERYLLFHERKLYKNMVVGIVGMGGSGKTTYSILSAMGSLILLSRVYSGFTSEKIRMLISSMTFFEPKSMVQTVREMIYKRRWMPFLIVDDIGSQISKYWIFLGQHFWSYLFSTLDQVKDWTGVLIMTAKSLNSIPSRCREIADIVVEAREVTTGNGIVADVFEFYRYEDYVGAHSRRSRLQKILFVDAIPPTIRIPDDLWETMMNIRRATGLRRLGIVERSLEMLPAIEKRRIEKTLKRLGIEEEYSRMRESEKEEEHV